MRETSSSVAGSGSDARRRYTPSPLWSVSSARRRRPHRPAPVPQAEPEPDPRAEALRAKLAEGKEIVEEREEFEAGETPVDEADLDERRRRVHEAARAAVEEMRSAIDSEEG